MGKITELNRARGAVQVTKLARSGIRAFEAGLRKRITEYTMSELDAAVAIAGLRVPGFYMLLRGIDAYMERRRRLLERGLETFMDFDEELPPPSSTGSTRNKA